MRSSRSSRKILTVRRGEELKVHVSDELCKETSFMNHAYRQALRAVAGIVQRTGEYHDKEQSRCSEYSADDELLAFGSNVVAFSAQRGCGKTSTMLSFSQTLGKMDAKMLRDENHRFLSKEDRDGLSHVRFHVLAPVSPSVLEEQQNILYVILARLYSYAWELIKRVECSKHNLYSERSDTAEQLEALKREIQECYDGVIGVKQETREMPRDILELQDICDGLSLCRHFFSLVMRITRCLGGDNHYLVLQLDDADSQVKNGFGVLEDVRKYLQVPNLIILLSADMELLHDSVRQNFQEYFPDRKEDREFQKRLVRMCRKYIDKLIPPTHLISLPQLDAKVDQYADNLQLDYQEETWAEPALDWSKGMGLQDMLLMLIYRKTGVIFAKPSGYPHSIIPTTLRGLNQLLRMLVDMEDIPLLKDTECFEDPDKFTEALQKLVIIQEYNLSQFADYFSNDWIYVKVSEQKDHDFLCSLRDANGERYVPMTVDYLCDRYDMDGRRVYNSVNLDALMYELQEKYNTQDDYYLLFAIRTLFTLKHHKMILAQKHDALSLFAQGKSALFAVDYDPEKLHLSSSYLTNPELLEISMGEAQSIRTTNQNKERYEKRRKHWDRKLNLIEERARQAESRYDEAQYRLEEAKSDQAAAERSFQSVDTQLKVAKAELEALQASSFSMNTAQERIIWVNVQKAVAHAQAVWDAELERRDTARIQVEKESENAQKAEREYRDSQQELMYYKTEIKMLPDYEETYKKALCVFGGSGDTFDSASDQVRPAFVVRNVLHDAWDSQEKRDRESMPPGKILAKQLLHNCMVGKDEHGYSCVNFMNFITFLLRLGAAELDFSKDISVPKDAQRMLYFAQECALAIAANWEVQDQLYRKMKIDFSETEASFLLKQNFGAPAQGRQDIIWLDTLFRSMDAVLQNQLNDGMVFSYLQENNSAIKINVNLPDRGTYWSINSGLALLLGQYQYYSSLLDFERALREIFDLPVVEKTVAKPEEVLKDTPDHKENNVRPDDMDDGQ